MAAVLAVAQLVRVIVRINIGQVKLVPPRILGQN
jgi:hypothetical protein